MDKRNLLQQKICHHVRQKRGRKTSTMCRLSSAQPRHQERQVSSTPDRGSLGQATDSQIVYKAGHQGCLSQLQNQGRRRMEDNLHHEIRHIRIFRYALWANQCTSGFPEMEQQDVAVIYRHMLHSISGRCPHIFRQSGTTPKGRGRHYPSNQKPRDETQTVKMRVSPTRNGIPRIHHQQRRSQSRPYQNGSHMGLETTYHQERNPRIHGILQLLPTVYRRIQQDSQTPIRQNQERRQMGMGGQGTSGVRRIMTEVMLNPSVDIL